MTKPVSDERLARLIGECISLSADINLDTVLECLFELQERRATAPDVRERQPERLSEIIEIIRHGLPWTQLSQSDLELLADAAATAILKPNRALRPRESANRENLNKMIEEASKHEMTPEEIAAQRESWMRQDKD